MVEVGRIELDLLGPKIEVPYRYSNKAKHISIRISNGIAELVLPNKNLALGHKFLLKKEAWVRQKLAKVKKQEETLDSNFLPFLGMLHRLEYVKSDYDKVEIKEQVMEVHLSLFKPIDILKRFLTKRLLEEVTIIANQIETKYNLEYSTIKITESKSKWGSCSSKKVLSFSLHLIFTPIEIIEYLVVHEMCHLVEMNHSEKYWAIVAKLYPKFKEAKEWLRKNQARLHGYSVILS